ncbi:MAG: hypothetical protein DDT31_01135 [Syntrophomonadaceae bacterium]|nr:hypothetical protein [Bacillota bacterium]
MPILRPRRPPPHRRGELPIGVLPIPVEEKFPINQTTPGVTITPIAELHKHAIRFSFAPIWRFRVPVDTQVIFRPGDRFYLHIRDGANVEWHGEQEVRISFLNAAQREMRVIYQSFYMEAREANNIDLMATYQIAELHVVPGGGWVFIEGFAPITPHTINSLVSHFSLDTYRIRQRI